MKLIGLMLVRNEDWIIGCSLRAALKWCDTVVVLDHASIDRTPEIVKECDPSGTRVLYDRCDDAEQWNEMELRQRTLEMGRTAGGTHFAIIDADEIPTGNVMTRLREWVVGLNAGDLLELPMLAMRTLTEYQDDDSVWSRAWLTLAFKDGPHLSWKPAVDGYQHHNRPPHGASGVRVRPIKHGEGGVMHLQFMNHPRLLCKHIAYRMSDRLRWPGRETVQALNWKYDQALQEPKKLTRVPQSWLEDNTYPEFINIDVPWQEAEIRRLLALHGREAFAGLDLKGF
jgi:hypothetical protein